MRSATRLAVVVSFFVFIVFTTEARADKPTNTGKGKPKVIFDEDGTPLERAIGKSVDDKIEHESHTNQACSDALADTSEPDAKKKNKKVAKACKAAERNSRKLTQAECPDCGDMKNKNGKVIGKKVMTETTLDYDDPSQRGQSKWSDIKLNSRLSNPLIGHDSPDNPDPNSVKVRSAGVFSGSSANDDKDCRDRVTGKHFGGFTTPTGNALIHDGDPNSCFDAGGKLKMTLKVVSGGCEHIESGTTYVGDPTDGIEDDCYDATGALKSTLEELIDEDPSEAGDDDGDGLVNEDPPGDADHDGNPNDDHDCIDATGAHVRGVGICEDAAGHPLPGVTPLIDEDGAAEIDNDGDGRVSEDGPTATNTNADCTNFGVTEYGIPPGLGTPQGQDGCDLSKAFIAIANKKAKDADPKHKAKIFQADENGVCDPTDVDGTVPCGGERRKTVLTEGYAMRCTGKAELIDGQCVTPIEDTVALFKGFRFFDNPEDDGISTHALLMSDSDLQLNSLNLPPFGEKSETHQMLMGFTFAPPIIEWGYKIDEEACIDLGLLGDFCFEVFYARVGYSFDLAVGLRLPVEVTVNKIPTPSVPAEAQTTLTTSLTPVDFTAKQYKDICLANHLDQERFISDCDRFSFPEYFDSLNPFVPDDQKDGKEFVAQASIFAGVQVRVLSVPIINYAIDGSADLPTLCTFLQIYNKDFDFAQFGLGAVNNGSDLTATLKQAFANCGSFTTPWGEEDNPIVGRRPRIFPISGSFDIPADCAQALVEGPKVVIKGKPRPICTGMILGMNGASLGIGLGLEATLGSTLITADFGVNGDAQGSNTGRVRFKQAPFSDPEFPTLGPIRFDNYSASTDTAHVTLDNFTYYLNRLDLVLNANLQFGGVLSVIPNLASIPIFRLAIDLDDSGIPIGQHAGMEAIDIPVFVENHALAVHASPKNEDANKVDDHTIKIKPGEFGDFKVQVDNRGSVAANMDNFTRTLSNRPNQSSPFTFVINPNTDFDCTGGGVSYRGYPYDGIADDCFAADGSLRADRVEKIDEDPAGPGTGPVASRDQDGDGLADEDPIDDWRANPAPAGFSALSINGVPPHSMSTDSVTLSVSPFRHPLTKPGLYPVLITADSHEGRVRGLDAIDPSGERRTDANDVIFVKVESFFDPQLSVDLPAASAKPGVTLTYSVEGVNGGNVNDTELLSNRFVDFNQAACTLTTLGSLPGGSTAGCPFRAVPTQIPASLWTTISTLDPQFGPLTPLGSGHDTFTIGAPLEWAGMQDTTYEIILSATSNADPALPPATNSRSLRHTVIATKESMTRYIGLEIAEFIDEIQKANANGVKTAGLLPINVHPITMMNDNALAAILAGNLGGASQKHASSIKLMEAIARAAAKVPAPYQADWTARSNAILRDLAAAQASMVTSIR